MDFFSEYFRRIAEFVGSADPLLLEAAVRQIRSTGERRGKIILVGNGGSAAMASHVAVDLTKVAGVRAINFNEADLLTCLANDYGYEHWVEQALAFYADPTDLVIAISSSGKSNNIVNGAVKARQMRLPLITLSGFHSSNPLRKLGDINFWVDSSTYNIVEMTHHVWLLAMVDRLAADKSEIQ